MKHILLLTAIALLSSCATTSYMKDDPLKVTAVFKDRGRTIVEASGVDTKGKTKFVYFQSENDYAIGDTVPFGR
jgi:predicted nucleic acid-binding Zn finger protein